MRLDILRKLLIASLVLAFLTASECFPTDDDDVADDDDVVADDDDASDDDDFTPPVDTLISGEVIAIDRDTNVELSRYQYNARAGGIILYVLPDAGNLGTIFAKVTMDGPGTYEVLLQDYVGPFDVVAVADEDKNHFIDSSDVAREFAYNPLAAAGAPIEEVNVYIDLLPPWSGGDDDDDDNGGCQVTELDGDVVIEESEVSNPGNSVAVTTNSASLAAGPWDWTTRLGAGPWSIAECDWRGSTALRGYLDDDGNGYYEPADPIGAATGNPFVLGIGDVSGIQVPIPTAGLVDIPAPPTYVALTGTVTYGAFTTGDILVHATHVTTDGQLFSSAVLAAPGAFSVIAPANTADVLVWAVLDENGDGLFDVASDPFASVGPMDSGTGVSGIQLDLGAAPSATISGVVLWDGPVAAIDVLRMGVFDTPTNDGGGPPSVLPIAEANVTFPYEFSFSGVAPGTYWVGTYLDVGADSPDGAGDEDPSRQIGPVLVAPGAEVVTEDIILID